MAKKDSKKKKDTKKGSGATDTTIEAVRSAVERALPDGSKERGAQIVDEVAKAVTRVRESLEQHGVLDELGKLRNEVEGLARRVANLERPSASTPAAKPAATRPRSTATRSRSTAARSTAAKSTASKPAAKKPAARKPAAKKPAASRSTSTRTRSTSTRSRSTGSGSGSSSS